ncbi:MAG: SufD family Fe-S cluster assembly protein [Erysipelotrichaceae bacterium]|nr:SufD family Fe-S cluster assembly protein [Erysipelotrichaceae bacterium]
MAESRFLQVSGKTELHLQESTVVTLVISGDTEIDYDLRDGRYGILIGRKGKGALSLKETGVLRNAEVKITYLELSEEEFSQDTSLEVKEGSSLEIASYYLVSGKKKVLYDIRNSERHTGTDVVNQAVCLDGSDLFLEVTGSIERGAKGSRLVQRSRCLSIGKPKRIHAAPILKIDENDVEAGHALSSGTIDDEILYYMNARGLDRRQALSLLIRGYLLPDAELYQEYPHSKELFEETERKVDILCSM